MKDPTPEAVARARRAAGLTQGELGERAGLSRRTIIDIERGRSSPRVSTLRKLAEVLGVPAGELVDPPPEAPPEDAPHGLEVTSY